MAKILGLDLGTNSIGWAVVDAEKKEIEGIGISTFQKGVSSDDKTSLNAAKAEKKRGRRQFSRKRQRKDLILILLYQIKFSYNICQYPLVFFDV